MTLTKMLVTLQIAFGDLRDRVRNQDSDRGATAVEYGLMVALIAGAIILTVTLLGTKLDGLFSSVSGALP